ncbi:hypothetical protein AXG93_3053s1040 [Marchantia polymorpha subsp. ruderalis]|uniref:NAD(P)-binding domain-containing protein n=1 Tax=Marchantia polymorpha subsp. ruderalis TaxID=1480154 RepID=A0A176WS54_MARPO|nr:hypothetical protein AXG93_3053s1040 [Marchantia polymorpha subsp. ruderalis]
MLPVPGHSTSEMDRYPCSTFACSELISRRVIPPSRTQQKTRVQVLAFLVYSAAWTDLTCFRDLPEDELRQLGRSVPETQCIRQQGRGLSVKEFVEACKAATKVNITVTILDRRPGDYPEVYSQPKKINDELWWKAKHVNLTETLEVAWKWQLKYPNGYNNEIVSAV